jgi:hypothetical protein
MDGDEYTPPQLGEEDEGSIGTSAPLVTEEDNENDDQGDE